MKRFIAVLSGLLVLPAFAEVAPAYYDEVVEYTDDMIDAEDVDVIDEKDTEVVTNQGVSQRNNINRSSSASRAISAGNSGVVSRTNTSSRAMASSPRSTTGTARGMAARTTKTNAVVSRTPTNSRTTVKSRNTQTTSKATTARVGTTGSVTTATRRPLYNSASTLTDSGDSLYNPNARVGVANRRSSARMSTAIKANTPTITEEDVSTTTNNLTAIAELTDYCKAQYAACMDNYCNVLDDNQGRCSCSKNIKNYAKTEAALASATEEFQNVVQKIKYIGLTGDQIKTLFTETEAEMTMKSNSDSSRLKTSLDAIRKNIVDVSTSSSSSASNLTNGISLDITGLLNADFTSGFDLSAFLGGTGNNTSSVSNQRGETLYKTAANRCRTAVLNSCTAQGIDANVITNSYDLEIDKQCMAYERSLNEANSEMRGNVTNAQYILQQARLLLAQNRNTYDLRDCVAAIDSCMQDDYVCGSDYELCLDPTGKYLANGEIVKGGTPGVSGGQNKTDKQLCATTTSPGSNCATIDDWTSGGMYNLYSVWNYSTGVSNGTKNAWGTGTKENLGSYIDEYLTAWKKNYKDPTKNEDSMASYLLQKIGYIDSDDKVHGMCASAMKQCQDYTFTNQASANKKYIFDNDVVRQFLSSTLAKIKVQQDAILADYAEGCRSDVQSCLSTNGYDESNTGSTASKTAVNACASEITTCMSVGGYQVKDGVKLTLRAMSDWVSSILINCPADTYLFDDGTGDGALVGSNGSGTPVSCKACPYAAVGTIQESTNSITVFRPNGEYIKTKSNGGQSTTCNCPEGYSDVYVTSSSNSQTTNDPDLQKLDKLRCVKDTEQ